MSLIIITSPWKHKLIHCNTKINAGKIRFSGYEVFVVIDLIKENETLINMFMQYTN